MKTKLLFLLIALLSNVNLCMAEGGNELPIIKEPKTNNEMPHRSHVYSVFGVFNTITQTLLLNVSEEADVSEVSIIKDGVLIISEEVSSEVPGMIMFDLSAYGTGTYQVEVITESGATYIGCFVK